ncbi:MAG TPA: SusC/RagA family TonB-linked outer membrane protein [Gemmatimonadaceae bacterium]|nr:SusC/RagA family TonB-linked outer membrane protein [Gemmatimonadaceae bacterium]
MLRFSSTVIHPRFLANPRVHSLLSTVRRCTPGALWIALIFGALLGSSVATAQSTGRITGVVTDSSDNRPLSAVRVAVVGTRLAAATDDGGRYTINGVPAGRYTLSARRLGYRQGAATGITVGDGVTATANFRLDPVGLTLEAVVTTGVVDPTSGTRVPFTVGRVDAENSPVPATNALETIQGKIAGATVIASGQPGSGTNILLRSPTSISKSIAPLIVVDGVVQAQSFTGSTADLESMDIESVEVVKGAAASSLFGSRAASGVIQIKTRRGSALPEGTTRVTARTELGTNDLGGKIHWAQNHYYMTNAQGQYVNAAGAVVTRAQRVAKPIHTRFQDVAYADPVYDQVDRFFDPGQFTKNSLSIAQNGPRTNWLLSLNNTREDGVVLNSGKYEQNNLRLNLDHRPIETLELSFSGYHSRSDRHELYDDTFFDLINQAPDIDLLVPDPDGTPYLFQGDQVDSREENPLYVLSTEFNRRKRARTQGSLGAKYSPLGWLSFDGNISYDRSDRRNDFFLDQGLKTEGFSTPLGGPGEIEQFTGTTNALNAAASANLLGRTGQLTLRSTLRALIERQSNQTTTAAGTIFSAPGVRSLSNAQQRSVSSLLEEVRASGYAVTTGADYAGRYIIDGLVRRDGSSLFGPEEQWNTYYRVSGAYRVSEESWWPIKSLDEFKLRASRGTAGTRPDFSDQYETFAFSEGGGLSKQTLGNKFLKPEHATETEVGIDAIFRQRFSLQLSYARNRVVDQLIQIPLAGLFGYNTQWQNAGTVTGNTIEGTLEAQVVRRPNFTWRMGVVADRSRNRITEFNRSCFSTQNIAFRCAGETLGAMYGFRFIKGIEELAPDAVARSAEFQVNDEGLLVWVGAGNTYQEGETKQLWGKTATIGTTNYQFGMPIVLRNATGSNALVKIGDGNPDLHWGFSNNISWNNLSVFALLDAQVGGDVYNETNQRMYQWARSSDVDQTGKEQSLKKPIEYYVNLYAANDPTDYFVEDAGFVKLREISLKYRLPNELVSSLGRVGVSGISLSLIGRNLKTWTNYKGYDPEVGGTIVRRDNFVYPRYRTFTGSVELTF